MDLIPLNNFEKWESDEINKNGWQISHIEENKKRFPP